MDHKYGTHCPNPTKTRFTSAMEAAKALDNIRKHPPRTPQGMPIRFYECQAGHWHLTSHKLRETGEHRPEDNVPADRTSPHEQRVERALMVLDMIEDAESQGGHAELHLPGGVRRRIITRTAR
jgi:hypothetical protein